MSIVEVHLPNIENFGKTPPYTETEILSKEYQDDFLVPGDDKHFLVLNKEKAWLVHADSLGAVAEELEGYLGMSVNDFLIISLGPPIIGDFLSKIDTLFGKNISLHYVKLTILTSLRHRCYLTVNHHDIRFSET